MLPDDSTWGLVVSKALSFNHNFSFLNRILLLLISSTVVSTREGGLQYVDGEVVVVEHAHRAVQGSIPVSQTFTAHVFECIGILLEPSKWTAVVRLKCSAYPLQPSSHSANTVTT